MRLDPLLNPRAVAIVGASERNHHGKQAADSLVAIGYAGPVYYINPSRKEVWGKPRHPDLKSTPTRADVAILVVNRERVLEVVRQCAEAGVKGLVINTDGFGEAADPIGRDLQRDLVALVRQHDLLLCGPNCLGMMNFHAKAAAYCGPVRAAVGRATCRSSRKAAATPLRSSSSPMRAGWACRIWFQAATKRGSTSATTSNTPSRIRTPRPSA